MRAVDFFCGAGGLTRGLIDAEIEVLVGIDADATAAETYESNNGVPFLQADMRTLSCRTLDAFGVRRRRGEPLLFAGCAPCQPFSYLNRSDDKRDQDLLEVFGKLVREYRPDFVLAENVPGIRRTPAFECFTTHLRSAGYDVLDRVLDAKRFGVPQTRRRLVIVGSLRGAVSLPPETHGGGLEPYGTVRGTIERFPKLRAGESAGDVPNHVASPVSPTNLERLRRTPPDGGSRSAWDRDARLRLPCYADHRGHEDVYGRMWWDRPAPTLTTKFTSITNGRFGHPEQDRALTPREGAALQSFADDYIFYGTCKHVARHVGNAVPPQLARQLGDHLLNVAKLETRGWV